MTWRHGALSDFLADMVAYRNVRPVDARVPGLLDCWQEVGLDHAYVPRKTAPEYAAALIHILRAAQTARGVAAPLRRLLFVGDTPMNDGTAARNLGAHLPMRGFIGADRPAQPATTEWQGELLLANRWLALGDWLRRVQTDGFPLDENTALLLDIDKTSLGARGRNDRVIDGARVAAIRRTMEATLDGGLGEVAFNAIYDPLNQPEHHPFTGDNQDYLAYITLMVLGGCCTAEELWQGRRDGSLSRFEDFVALCDGRRARMSAGLSAAHQEVCQGLAAEDPTPFKGFRRVEYLETVGRMNALPDDATAEDVLAREIVLTAEVYSLACRARDAGALVFGLSDKPDEASIPTAEYAARGYQPLHRTTVKIYGQALI